MGKARLLHCCSSVTSPGDASEILSPRRGELFLLPFSQMFSNSWQLVVKHVCNIRNTTAMPRGTVRLRLADCCVACSLSTALLNDMLGAVVLCIGGALKTGVILDEQFVLIPLLSQGDSLWIGGPWLHLVVMAKWGGDLCR